MPGIKNTVTEMKNDCGGLIHTMDKPKERISEHDVLLVIT